MKLRSKLNNENLRVSNAHTNLYSHELHIAISIKDLHSTMSCVLSGESLPTPLEALQVMVAKALSLITLVSMRVVETLNIVALGVSVLFSSDKSILPRYHKMSGEGTPVAMHTTKSELPSDTVTVGFWEFTIAASGATDMEKRCGKGLDYANKTTQTMPTRKCWQASLHLHKGEPKMHEVSQLVLGLCCLDLTA